MIPNEVVIDILSKADIVQIISNYINVIKKGRSYVAVCPFHNDSNPSLMISPEKQIYKCFACGAGGNAITFVQNYEKITYEEAILKVAQLINYSSPLISKFERKVDPKIKVIIDALKDATNFYSYILNTQAGLEGKKYFNDRNITEDMIEYFSLGFAPVNGELTIKQLRAKKHDVEALDKAGILLRQGSTFTDRFSGRVMFPIHNEYGEVIGFSGRRVDDSLDVSKYVNSPSTLVFNKSDVLYNYQNAKNESKREKYCYVVEGFMDVFSLYRVGIKACVAVMGTAFTKYHAKMLKRLNVEIRLCLDGDDAGQHGMVAASKILDQENVPYKFVNYKDEVRDPDEIYNQAGGEYLLKVVNCLSERIEFILNYYAKKNDLKSPDGKKEFVNSLLEYYYSLPDLDRDLLAQKIGELVGLSSDRITRYYKSRPIKTKAEIEAEKEEFGDIPNLTNIVPKIRKKGLKARNAQRKLIYWMLKKQSLCDYINKVKINIFIDDIYILLAGYITELYKEKNEIELRDVINAIQSTNDSLEHSQRIISEIIEIDQQNQSLDVNDIEKVKEVIDTLIFEINKTNTNKLINDESLNLSDIEKARIIDARRKGAN